MPGRGKPKFSQWGSTAEHFYVVEGRTAEEISTLIPVSAKSIRAWAEKGDWDTLRKIRTVTDEEAVQIIRQMMVEVLVDIREKKKTDISTGSDQLSKLRRSMEVFSKSRDPLGETKRVLDEFSQWLMQQNMTTELKALAGVLKRYGEHVINKARLAG